MRFLCFIFFLAVVYGRNLQKETRSDEDDDNHWEDAWMVEEQDLANLEKEEVQAVENAIRADLSTAKEALKNLLSGKESEEDGEIAEGLIMGAIGLADLHASQGVKSIPPKDLKAPAGCSADEIVNLDSCDSQLQQFGKCLVIGIEEIERLLDETDDALEKVGFLKGVVHKVAEVSKGVIPKLDGCFEDDKKRKIKAPAFKMNSRTLTRAKQDNYKKLITALRGAGFSKRK